MALISSRQISWPTRNILPAPAFGPVSDIPNPIRIGSAAKAPVAETSNPAAVALMSSCRRLRTEWALMDILQLTCHRLRGGGKSERIPAYAVVDGALSPSLG